MLYNLMNSYRAYLETSYSPATAKVYYERLCTLLEDQSITDTVGKLDVDKVIKQLEKIRYKNHFSQSKNAFLHFCEFQNVSIPLEKSKRIDELGRRTHKKYRKRKTVDFQTVGSRIKHIKNDKLKLSYETILATGLRVSELSQIASQNCIATESGIDFHFIGKGGQNEVVTLSKSEYPKLYGKVKKQMENMPPTGKVFYSANYLQHQAKKLGFQCHDLRRAFARIEYKKTKSKKQVMQKLRHAKMKTTNLYLNSKVTF